MAKTLSKSRELQYARYKNSKIFEANRKRKLLKLIKQQPNNEQLVTAFSSIRSPRSAPKVPKWSHTSKADAFMFATFKKQPPSQPKGARLLVMPVQPFSIGARARYV